MAHREFQDQTGTPWTVWDVHPMHAPRMARVPATAGATPRAYAAALERGGHAGPRGAIEYVEAALAAGWLCFESSSGKRRLAPIPSGWEALPSDSLLTLCEQATPVAPPRRRRG